MTSKGKYNPFKALHSEMTISTLWYMTDPGPALTNYRNVPAIPKNNYYFNYNNWLCSLDKLTYSWRYCHGLQCYSLEKSVVIMYCKMWWSHCLKELCVLLLNWVQKDFIPSAMKNIQYFCIRIIKKHSSKHSEHFVLKLWLNWNLFFDRWISGKPH